MPTFRHTLTFVGPNGSRWNEVYYQEADNVQSAALTARFASARLALLAQPSKLRTNRIAQVDQPRVTRQVTYNLNGTGGGSFTTPAPETSAIVLGLTSAAGGSRKLWMRGLPSNYINIDQASGQDRPSSVVIGLIGTFIQEAANAKLGIRKIAGISPGPTSPIKILTVDGSRKDGTSDVTLAAAPGYPFPARVSIGGASKKDLPNLNGQWSLVKAVNLAVVTIPYQTPQGLVVVGGNAHMRQAVYPGVNVFDPNNSGFDHYGSHATRQSDFGSRGARRAARLRTSL